MEQRLFTDIIFIIVALAGSIALGGLTERVVLQRLLRRAMADEAAGEPVWTALRGLGWWTGAWIGIRIVLEQNFLNAYWQTQAWLAWKVFGILIGTIFLARITSHLVRDSTSEVSGVLPSVSLLHYVVQATVYAIGFLIILNLLGLNITPALTALGVGGLAVALALQDTLSNLFAGIQIIASRKMQPGQYIRLASGEEGSIQDITWRNTTLLTMSNQLIIIPNKTISGSIVTNTWLPDTAISVPVECGVHYDSDLARVEEVAIAVGIEIQQTIEGAVPDHIPVLRFYQFGPSSVDFRVIMRAQEYSSQFAIRSEMVKALHRRFKEEGIEIPFPIRTLHLDEQTRNLLGRKNE